MVNLTPHRDSSVIEIATWLFPIAVWALATLLLKGDLGAGTTITRSVNASLKRIHTSSCTRTCGIFTLSQQISHRSSL